jgi:hypothetical protein
MMVVRQTKRIPLDTLSGTMSTFIQYLLRQFLTKRDEQIPSVFEKSSGLSLHAVILG